ncbi:MAG: transcription antitermination factor NusB [Myxococcota bacterium]
MVARARRVAVGVLSRIERDGAWATPTLDTEINRAGLERVDAALATQIVYGALRVRPSLEAVVEGYANRPVKVDPWTHAALLAGAFQLLHLSRVPSHAVVDDSVSLVREKRGSRVAGFVNAVLRKVARQRPVDAELPASIVLPDWLDKALRVALGDADTEALLRLSGDATTTDVRVPERSHLQDVADSIREAHPDASVARTRLSARGLRMTRVGDPRRLAAYERGEIAVQEEGAQLIGAIVDAKPGDRVLDVCAGRGGKTVQLVEAVGPTGEVVATDVHARRLSQIPEELSRLGLPTSTLRTATVDWTVGPGEVSGTFDRVLIDAPCTGLGTLRRRPEILLRADPALPAQMGETQLRILERAAARVRPGGTLVYAVCSPLPEEGFDVVSRASLPAFQPAKVARFGLNSERVGTTPSIRLGPFVEGAGPWADAYQVSVWVNVG